eukprot:3102101-Pyramimonas_sp.AAC.1
MPLASMPPVVPNVRCRLAIGSLTVHELSEAARTLAVVKPQQCQDVLRAWVRIGVKTRGASVCIDSHSAPSVVFAKRTR